MTIREIREIYNSRLENKDISNTISDFLLSKNSESEDAKEIILYLNWVENKFSDFLTQ